jgi:hypothetical protein
MNQFDKRGVILFSAALIAFAASIYAVRAFQKMLFIRQANLCHNVLRRIDNAKEQYSYPKGITNGPVTIANLQPFLGEQPITCPAGARIDINEIGWNPKCMFHGGIEGGTDFRDFRFPWYPFRQNDWLYLSVFFLFVISCILFITRKKRQRAWDVDTLLYSLVAAIVVITSVVLRDPSDPRRIGRQEWLRITLGNIKAFSPKWYDRPGKNTDYIEGAACLKLADGWVYVVTHSIHADVNIGDVVLCKDSNGNMYYSGTHPCTAIAINNGGSVRNLTVKDFIAKAPEPAVIVGQHPWQRLPGDIDGALRVLLDTKLDLEKKGAATKE